MIDQQQKSDFYKSAMPLLCILLIDGMGLGLVFPLLNGLIFSDNDYGIAAHYSPLMQNVLYGGIVAIFMLCWFFGAAWLGDLSDRIGRKKSLLICLIGTALGYVLSAASVMIHNVSLLILGRVIAGLCSGSQPIAQAAIVDLSTEETKARNLGYVLLSLSIGFILGPTLGGLLIDKTLVSWFNYSTPFIFATTIASLNAIILFFTFKETFIKLDIQHLPPLRWHRAISIFISAFERPNIRGLSIGLGVFVLAWSNFYSFAPLFLMKEFNSTTTQVSLFMGVMGIGFAVGNGVLVEPISRRFSKLPVVTVSILIGAILTFCIIATKNFWLTWILVAPLCAVLALAYAMILAMFSDQVSAEEQGWVMGITGSIMALMWAVDTLIVSALAAINYHLPFWITAFGLMITVLWLNQLRYSKSSKEMNLEEISNQNMGKNNIAMKIANKAE